MIIRKADIKDIVSIAKLHAESWQENYHTVLSVEYLNEKVFDERMELWSARLSKPLSNQLVLVAEVNDAFCGFICAFGANHPKFGTIIDNLHVKPEAKGKGIGSKLMLSIAKWANSYYKDHDLYLEVLECNAKAIGFYQALGAKNIDIAYWHTPCGNKAKEFIYSWGSPNHLIKNQLNE